ncbi:hypothetical protein EIN_249440 [Entamoeba invadens IP1]|uniref:Uncharacterized protein n=1 Tax=Entamoeba invadens IP1 TaxID=370355 RepID=A0A0A1UE85_ENTIV|nr:hypothetical protein EIN_249440 [Entamoeba invadens IP1]ELP94900.1 hypothetical protein EIN_249440 [Entamoeba invadens IP1]|eukprot:XP_004261671.1 hypothetical protein EIN_249440 [Entamoeba invadens IP1]
MEDNSNTLTDEECADLNQPSSPQQEKHSQTQPEYTEGKEQNKDHILDSVSAIPPSSQIPEKPDEHKENPPLSDLVPKDNGLQNQHQTAQETNQSQKTLGPQPMECVPLPSLDKAQQPQDHQQPTSQPPVNATPAKVPPKPKKEKKVKPEKKEKKEKKRKSDIDAKLSETIHSKELPIPTSFPKRQHFDSINRPPEPPAVSFQTSPKSSYQQIYDVLTKDKKMRSEVQAPRERNDRPERTNDRVERKERPLNPERVDKPIERPIDRPERVDKYERSERSEILDRRSQRAIDSDRQRDYAMYYQMQQQQFQPVNNPYPPLPPKDVYYRAEHQPPQQPMGFQQVNVFDMYEKLFIQYGARVDLWPQEALAHQPRQTIQKDIAMSMKQADKTRKCSPRVRHGICAMAAIRYFIEMIRAGKGELPFCLEMMYKDGWERSCDVCLLNEMDSKGLELYKEYLKNDCINYILTIVMKLSPEQQLFFIEQRSNFLIKCLTLRM